MDLCSGQTPTMGGGDELTNGLLSPASVYNDEKENVATRCDEEERHDPGTTTRTANKNNKDYHSLCPPPPPTRTMSIDEAIEHLGEKNDQTFQFLLLIVAGLCYASNATQIAMLGLLPFMLQADFEEENWLVTSIVYFGASIGTLICGRLGDVVGRRPAFLQSAIVVTIFGFFTALVPPNDILTLLFVRFCTGLGIGGLTIPFDLLAEFVPTHIRGRYLTMIQYFWTAGSMYVPIAARLSSAYSWRTFVVICTLPSFLSVVLGYCILPESPRWLVSVKKNKLEALRILKNAATWNYSKRGGLFDDVQLRDEIKVESLNPMDLFKPHWRRLTLTIWILWAGMAFSYLGVIILITRIFETNSSSRDNNDNDDNNQLSFDYGALLVSASAEIVGTALIIVTIDCIGRVASQVWSYTLVGMTLWAMCLLASGDDNTISYLLLLGLSYIVRICEMVGSSATWAITAEIYTTEIRTTGHCVANAVGRLGGMLSPFVISLFVQQNSTTLGTFLLLLHVTMACMAYFCLPETTGQLLG